MLGIREAQMSALAAAMRRSFAQAVVDAAEARGELGTVPRAEALERAALGGISSSRGPGG